MLSSEFLVLFVPMYYQLIKTLEKIVRFINFLFKGHFRFAFINRRRIGGRKDGRKEGQGRKEGGGANNILNGLTRVVDFAQPLVHTGCPYKHGN